MKPSKSFLLVAVFSFCASAQLADTLPTEPKVRPKIKELSVCQIFLGTGLPFWLQFGISVCPTRQIYLEGTLTESSVSSEARLLFGFQHSIYKTSLFRTGVGWLRHSYNWFGLEDNEGLSVSIGYLLDFREPPGGFGARATCDFFTWKIQEIYPSAQPGLFYGF